MSILINENTRVLVQGITGKIGRIQTRYMLEAGTKIVAGVTPGRGGSLVEGIPVFDTVKEAVESFEIEATVLFVPPRVAGESVIEAAEAGINLITLITEHTPVHDVMVMKEKVNKLGSMLIGPTTPGIIVPGKCKIGIMPANMFTPGPVGVVSRSGTLSYEVAASLSDAGLGQSTVVGMGADLVAGTSLTDILRLFNNDPETEFVVLVGEVGGSQEEEAAEFISSEMNKPVISYIAGASAPPGKRMGHAGAIIEKGQGSARGKIDTLAAAGSEVAISLSDISNKALKILKDVQ